jgi:CheY-like chemotaxis protein
MNNNKILSVLLAEDNPISSKLAQINIQKMGHKLDVVNNGKEAVKKFMNNKYDVILMDIEMPVMNGLDAAKKIREIEKSTNPDSHVKIVAMTAHDDDQARLYFNYGLDDYCQKPYKKQQLSRLFED